MMLQHGNSMWCLLCGLSVNESSFAFDIDGSVLVGANIFPTDKIFNRNRSDLQAREINNKNARLHSKHFFGIHLKLIQENKSKIWKKVNKI